MAKLLLAIGIVLAFLAWQCFGPYRKLRDFEPEWAKEVVESAEEVIGDIRAFRAQTGRFPRTAKELLDRSGLPEPPPPHPVSGRDLWVLLVLSEEDRRGRLEGQTALLYAGAYGWAGSFDGLVYSFSGDIPAHWKVKGHWKQFGEWHYVVGISGHMKKEPWRREPIRW